MLNIWNWFMAVERHAVDVILADIHGLIGRLEASAEKHADDAVKAAGLADFYKSAEEVAAAEAERAKVIAANIAALVTVKGI